MSGCGNYARFGENEEEGNLVRTEGEKQRQYQAAILAALAGTAAGTGDGWLMTSLVKHKENFLNSSNMFLFVNIMNFAALTGAVISGYLVDKIGRKQTLILAGLLTLPTWILYTISHKILISLSIGTALGGFASGAVSVVVPLYIAEISESSVRGSLGIFFYLQFIAGELFTTIEGKEVNMNVVAANCILVATLFLVTFIWMPESPFSLISKREENEAKNSLKFFRGANYNIEEEIEDLKQSASKKTPIKETLKEENMINPLILSLTLMFLSRIVAVDGFNFRLYKVHFLFTDDLHTKITTFYLLIQIIGLIGAAFFIERLGRRLLLIISASTMLLSGLVFILVELVMTNYFKSIPIFFFSVYTIAFSFGVGPVPWVLMNELFPYQNRALSSTFSAGLFWFMAFTSSMRFHLLLDNLGPLGTLCLYLILCASIIAIAVFVLPETQGRKINTIVIPNIKNFIFRNRVTNTVNV